MAHQKTSFKSLTGLLILFLSLLVYISGCYYDKEAELYPFSPQCDTTNVTYSVNVAPVMSANCNVCHTGTAASAGVKTDNYNDLMVTVNNGKLWGSIHHDPGYKPMPNGLPQISPCDMSRIRKWIDMGAPNN
jgi:mono/diheme cytochrome c family protein